MKLLPTLLMALSWLPACNDSQPRLPEEGDPVRYLRVSDYGLSCFETYGAENRVFRDQDEWNNYFSRYVSCYDSIDVLTGAPVFDFDRHVLIMAVHEADCVYSGCGNLHPLITDIRIIDGKLTIDQREAFRWELGSCFGCVQPRDFVLVDRDIADAFEFDFTERVIENPGCF